MPTLPPTQVSHAKNQQPQSAGNGPTAVGKPSEAAHAGRQREPDQGQCPQDDEPGDDVLHGQRLEGTSGSRRKHGIYELAGVEGRDVVQTLAGADEQDGYAQLAPD